MTENENSEETKSGNNPSNQPIKKRPPRKPPMENKEYIEEAKKEMETLAPLLQLFRKASGISVAKMCEDCGISHATWENIEKGKDIKQSTFQVFLDHLFQNADRFLNYPVLLINIIQAELNDEYLFPLRVSKHESPLPPMSDCILGFKPHPNWYNDEKTMQLIEELNKSIEAKKAEHKAEKENLKAEIEKEKAEKKKLREEIKKLKAEKKNGN